MPRTKELSSDQIAEQHFELHGPYDRDQTIKAVYVIDHLVRYLNYATSEPTGLPYPASIYDLIGTLKDTASKLPQTLQQTGHRLGALAQDPTFVDRSMPSFWDRKVEAHDSAVTRAEQARAELDRARALAQELAAQLETVQGLISSLGMDFPDTDDEDED